MKKIDTVIFDMDGTLLDTLDDLTASVNFAMRKYGYPEYVRPQICNFVGHGLMRLIELAIPNGKDNPDFDNLFADFKDHYNKHCNDLTGPYNHIPELLAELKKRGYKMAIVSNKADGALKELSKIYFSKYIDVTIGEKEGIRKKPAPDTVIKALEELGSDKEHSIYVGDSEVDFATAKNSELRGISCAWGFRGKEYLEKLGAEIIISDPLELVDLIEKL